MNSLLTKKVLVVASVVLFIVFGAIVLAFTTGNTYYPSLSDPDGVFYQRVDDNGKVLYEITNKELYEEIKQNNGIEQLLFMVDEYLLESYIDEVTADQIEAKIKQLTYGTSDPTEIAEIDADTLANLETAFEQSMILAGFQNNPEDYAALMIAREELVYEKALENEEVTDKEILTEYINAYFSDISAIKIRFTSEEDAEAVMQMFNLVSLSDVGLREYNGYIFLDETELDADDNIAEAYKAVDVYYKNGDDDILDIDGNTLYEYGANDFYTDSEDNIYAIDPKNGDLLNGLDEVVLEGAVIFDTRTEALEYRDENIEFFTVNRVDPYDQNETIQVKDSLGVVAYTIDPDGHIFDAANNDVTYTTDLVVNKQFKTIDEVTKVTSNNSTELTDEEVLAKFIKMYNYVYADYRDTLPENANVDDLVALDNDFLSFEFESYYEANATVAEYLFSDLSIVDGPRYTVSPEDIITNGTTFTYLMFKLTEPTKEDVYDTMFDSVEETIVVPAEVADDITLKTSGFYGSTITWTSSKSDLLSKTGDYNTPDEDTNVTLTYTINLFNKTRTNTVVVRVLKEGETSNVAEVTAEEIPYKDILNDPTAYSYLKNKLYDEFVYGEDSETNVNNLLNDMRGELGFTINDYYVALDYTKVDSYYEFTGNGDKTVLFSFEKTLVSDDPVEFTADDFFNYVMKQNPALYTLYASQYKEILTTTYFNSVFGTQTDLRKNKSDRMEDMYQQITDTKQYYSYLVDMYAQYGLSAPYSSFSDYSYAQFGAKTELALLEYFVQGAIQPYLIDYTINAEEVVKLLYPTVTEYFDNYFSLDTIHILTYVDYDEDGVADNYNDFIASLSQAELDTFNTLIASLQIEINEYEGTFDALAAEFNAATRDDETWGDYKQFGLFLKSEDLNFEDSETGESHSLEYSGEYGIKDKFVPEFTDALIELYAEYSLPQNADVTELTSNLVTTEFGLHIIQVGQGDNFDKPTFDFSEEDSDNPEYSVGIENDNEAPTLEQLELYATYKFYAMVYDLTDANLEETYGITLPTFPSSVKKALDYYFDDLLSEAYVLGVINVYMADQLADGEFFTSTNSTYTNAELMNALVDIRNIYFDAIFGAYEAD
jgi:hypothetical protein